MCNCSQYRGAFDFSALGALQVDSILYGCPNCTVSLAAPYEGILVSRAAGPRMSCVTVKLACVPSCTCALHACLVLTPAASEAER